MRVHAANIRSWVEEVLDGLEMTTHGRDGKPGTAPMIWLIDENAPEDPWGNEYQLMWKEMNEWSVRSAGPDGKPGTTDDIIVWGQS